LFSKGVAVAAGWDQLRMATHVMIHGAWGRGMALLLRFSPVGASLVRDAAHAPALARSAPHSGEEMLDQSGERQGQQPDEDETSENRDPHHCVGHV
jgi:hypothetical protein